MTTTTHGEGIYIASKARHGETWRRWRAEGVPFISTWIDECEAGSTNDWPGLWTRCIEEPKSCAAFVLYVGSGDVLKGALVEMGAALAAGRPVFVAGNVTDVEQSSLLHPLVTKCENLDDAIAQAWTVVRNAAEARDKADRNAWRDTWSKLARIALDRSSTFERPTVETWVAEVGRQLAGSPPPVPPIPGWGSPNGMTLEMGLPVTLPLDDSPRAEVAAPPLDDEARRITVSGQGARMLEALVQARIIEHGVHGSAEHTALTTLASRIRCAPRAVVTSQPDKGTETLTAPTPTIASLQAELARAQADASDATSLRIMVKNKMRAIVDIANLLGIPHPDGHGVTTIEAIKAEIVAIHAVVDHMSVVAHRPTRTTEE